MSLPICPSLGHNQQPHPHPSPAAPTGPWIRPLPGLDEWPCSSSNLLVPGAPQHPVALFPFLSTLSSSLCPSLSSSCSPQGPAGLASTQSSSISSTFDIIGTEKSWEHSFPMILKWHQGHSGLLAKWLAEWLDDWLALKKRPEVHNSAGLAFGLLTFHAPKHLITAPDCFTCSLYETMAGIIL